MFFKKCSNFLKKSWACHYTVHIKMLDQIPHFRKGEHEKLHNAASYGHRINLNRGDATSLGAQREGEVPGTAVHTEDEKPKDKWPSLGRR